MKTPLSMSPVSSVSRVVGSLLVLAAGCGYRGGRAAAPGAEGLTAPTQAQTGAPQPVQNRPPHAFDYDDMASFQRLDELAVSPDGKRLAFTVKTPNVATNKIEKDVWTADVETGSLKRMTDHAEADFSPQFSADGKQLYFLSTRDGSSQVWQMPVSGGEASKLTKLPVDVEGFKTFPDGARLLLILSVYPDAATLDETASRDKSRDKDPSKVRAYDALPIRHWDAWDDGKRNHLFVWSPNAAPVDLLKGSPDDAPPKPFGGMEEVAISKDGKDVVFAAKMMGREAAWSTNTEIWWVPAEGGQKPQLVSEKSPGEDSRPLFSPDGNTLAYLSMPRAGYESDRRRVMVFDWKSKAVREIAPKWDRSPSEIVWSPDGKTLFATADHLGRHAIFSVALESGQATPWSVEGHNQQIAVAQDKVVYLHDSLRQPAEIWASPMSGQSGQGGQGGQDAKPVTHVNDARLANVMWGEPEQFTFTGAKGDKVYAWMIKPVGIAAGTKAPIAMLIHGGPQGSFGDHFHYRWNPEVFAAHGYATVMVDFHGSTGYGQAFTDAIRGDWGGAPFEDIMKGLDAAKSKYDFVDASRAVGLGASYGGFMINWINGNTDRFKALVCHDGNIDEPQAYFETEELWFPEWEHGKTPWENAAGYEKHNPRKLVHKWKTPTLVVHGGRDYRVVDTQGMATFTALQRRGIESRFLHFPDENHWVLKPANSKRWHQEVLAWIDRFTKK